MCVNEWHTDVQTCEQDHVYVQSHKHTNVMMWDAHKNTRTCKLTDTHQCVHVQMWTRNIQMGDHAHAQMCKRPKTRKRTHTQLWFNNSKMQQCNDIMWTNKCADSQLCTHAHANMQMCKRTNMPPRGQLHAQTQMTGHTYVRELCTIQCVNSHIHTIIVRKWATSQTHKCANAQTL